MELTSALQSEQHVKKEVARKIGELQEDVVDMKEKVLISPKAPNLNCLLLPQYGS